MGLLDCVCVCEGRKAWDEKGKEAGEISRLWIEAQKVWSLGILPGWWDERILYGSDGQSQAGSTLDHLRNLKKNTDPWVLFTAVKHWFHWARLDLETNHFTSPLHGFYKCFDWVLGWCMLFPSLPTPSPNASHRTFSKCLVAGSACSLWRDCEARWPCRGHHLLL